MQPRRFLLTALFATLAAVAVVSGCAGTASESEAAADDVASKDQVEELPEWVRIVPRSAEGATWFVGGVSMAVDVGTGIELATADALSQIANEAADRVNSLYTRGVSRSGVTTTPEERLFIKSDLTDAYSERMEAAAARENEYHRPCGGPGDGDQGPVCQVFVLVSVQEDIWDREMTDSLVEVRKSRRTQSTSVELLDWMLRDHGEGAARNDGQARDAHDQDGRGGDQREGR